MAPQQVCSLEGEVTQRGSLGPRRGLSQILSLSLGCMCVCAWGNHAPSTSHIFMTIMFLCISACRACVCILCDQDLMVAAAPVSASVMNELLPNAI